MSKAGGIIAMVAGVFSIIAAIVTLMVGGLGSAFKAHHADTVVGLGWGGVVFSFLVIVFGAVAFFKPKGAGLGLIICSIAGAVLGGTFVAIFMVLSLIGGIVCIVGGRQKQESGTGQRLEPTQGAATYLQLERLADLKNKGVLTEAEFRTEKTRLLSGTSAAEQGSFSILPASNDETVASGIHQPPLVHAAASGTSQRSQIAPQTFAVPVGTFCGNCGTKHVTDGKFCGICGTGVTQLAPTVIQLTAIPYVLPPPSGQQPCTNCGKINGPMARFCNACGSSAPHPASSMSPGLNPQYGTTSPSRMGMGKKLAIVGASLFVALIAASAVYQATPEGKAAVVAEEKDGTVKEAQRQQDNAERRKQQTATEKEGAVSAATLKAAYEQNEISADNEYKGKLVVVHGRIGTIGKDITDTSYVTLDEGELGIGSIQCFFDDSSNARLAKLSPGESIYIKGTVDGKMLNVLIKNSMILE